jgi:hypothetical protein
MRRVDVVAVAVGSEPSSLAAGAVSSDGMDATAAETKDADETAAETRGSLWAVLHAEVWEEVRTVGRPSGPNLGVRNSGPSAG